MRSKQGTGYEVKGDGGGHGLLETGWNGGTSNG